MKQEINFYRGDARARGFALTLRSILWAGFGVLAVLGLVTLFEMLSLQQLREQVSKAREQAQTLETQAQQLQGQIPEPKPDTGLLAQAEQQQRRVDDLKQLLQAVKGDQFFQRGGFSSYFEALARQTRANIWLREIRLQAGGKQIELAGSALNSELIPRMVQSLGLEEAFKRRTFSDLTIHRPSRKQGEVHFVLRTEIPEGEKRGQP